ncbi:MAG TPA: HAMP domain-containing sensor histidine kinase [Streptosporangiaceae bacterium]|nr:HAMP domain-containing sensor histidine kinase [Streptosporangiaceae bacterium]
MNARPWWQRPWPQPWRRPWRRPWPQKVRTRLALIYAALFFVAGLALLGLTYGLVASSLPTQPPAGDTVTNQALSTLLQECKSTSYVLKGNHLVPASTPLLPACKQAKVAYAAGTAAGLQAQRNRALSDLLLFSLAGLGIMTVASGGLGWFMSGRVLRPVRVITETARRASEQHLGERLAFTGARDELKELADTFDDMLGRLDVAFATQGRFVANASHELRTPLTVMRTAIDVTLAKPSPTARQLTDMAVRVRRSIERAEAMIEALLTLAVSDRGKLSTEFADLATWAEDAIDAAAPEIERLDLRVEAQLDPAETTGDPQLLERMIWNLVDNAVRHNEPGGWIRLHTGAGDGDVFLEIANSGPFIPDDAVPSLFEPFRRMRARTGVREGVGLGLSIARSVGTAHRATVTARSQPGGGLDISVVIPRCRATAAAAPADSQPLSGGSEVPFHRRIR